MAKLIESPVQVKTNEERIQDTLNDTDFLNSLNVSKEDVIKQVKLSEEQFNELNDYVNNYTGTFGELYKELSGWNLADKDLEQDDDNLFDCYYKSLLVTVTVDDGKLSVVPEYVYVYPTNITDVDSDELFELDFNKPIDFSKFENAEVKTEGVQEDRLNNSIQMYKDRGYEEYSSGDKYVALLDNKNPDSPVCVMFYGKSYKPAWHYRFKNMEELDNYLQKYLSDKDATEKAKADRKEQRKLTKDHNVKVGDIYYTSWGYDQTNIDYYEVVGVRGVRIDLKELAVDYVGHEGQYDEVVPIPGKYASDKVYTVSARADGTLTSLSSFEHLRKWDGQPNKQTDVYSGH